MSSLNTRSRSTCNDEGMDQEKDSVVSDSPCPGFYAGHSCLSPSEVSIVRLHVSRCRDCPFAVGACSISPAGPVYLWSAGRSSGWLPVHFLDVGREAAMSDASHVNDGPAPLNAHVPYWHFVVDSPIRVVAFQNRRVRFEVDERVPTARGSASLGRSPAI